MNTKKMPVYPIEPWDVTETEFSIKNNYRNETTFALSNGYIGTRGTFEEGYDFSVEEGLEGNFINGFYESEEIRYGEWNFGFPTKSQSLLNVCNGKIMRVYLDGECLDLRKGKTTEYKRSLHMKEGTVTRELTWISENGKKLKLKTERLVSLTEKNMMAVRMSLCLLPEISKDTEELIKDAAGENKGAPKTKVRIESELNADVENHTRKTNPLVDYGPFGRRLCKDILLVDQEGAYYEGTTLNSKLSMACAVFHDFNRMPEISFRADELCAENSYEWNLLAGEEIVIDKFILYTASLDMQKEQMKTFAEELKKRIKKEGYQTLKEKQLLSMSNFWENADVEIKGNDALQQGMRFNLFHIMQAAGRDGRTGMGAKGLSGEGYEGHYFWDTEMYVLPVFIYTYPELAKNLLRYRYDTLNPARDRARVLGHEKGALYPWRTINGEEASTYFPLGTAQYHINGDIAYAFFQYFTVTQDYEFLKEAAAEVLVETARVFADVGCFAECRDGKYCICSVTGPDEYNAIVDNNFYTNLMARENLRAALKALELLKDYDQEAYENLIKKLSVTEEETNEWHKIIDKMYFPYDEKRGVYSLDDGFMMRKPWDDSKIPPEKRHLLYENYHPLFIYRQRMSKQADAILGMYLHSNYFTKEELKRNYDFYQEVTLHHSSLSTCIFGIVACETGDYEDACRYFSQSARMDLDDYHENFYAGIHAANMAGTWQSVINGFAGLRTNKGTLSFAPYLPSDMESFRFRIGYRGRKLEVLIEKKKAVFTLLKGTELSFLIKGREIQIKDEGGKHIEAI